MNDSRSDRTLVAAHLGGDRSALGDIYDRYAPVLYDTAAAMLRDPHEGADAVQDVFVAASQHLGQLRNPDRLRPWLFAILRNEVYRRSSRQARMRPMDLSTTGMTDMAASDDPRAEGAAITAAELAAEVRAAAAGLDTRDQLILELSARQKLAGADLAAALGVTPQQCHVLVHRMRDRVARSLGALTVARMGAADCSALAALLRGWDGRFTVQVRKRVAAHVDACEACQETSRRYAVVSLMGLAPALVAPAALRQRALSAAESSRPAAQHRFATSTGFPHPPRRPTPWLVAAAMVMLAALAALTTAWVKAGDAGTATQAAPPTPAATAASSTSSAPSSTSAPTSMASPTSDAEVASSPPSTSVTSSPLTTAVAPVSQPEATDLPPPPPAPPGRLELSSSSVDLGSDQPSATVTLRNTGGRPVDWQLIGDPGAFEWSSTAGTVDAGETAEVQVGIERDPLPEGALQASVAFAASTGPESALSVSAAVERPPDVQVLRVIGSIACPWSVDPTVAAVVTDESMVSSVRLSWSGPGPVGAADMTSGGPDQWRGRLSMAQRAGAWTWTVTATDDRANARSISGEVVVSGTC
jgi:RNA polymerase sigma factor (sigma-70 family)